MAVKWLSHFRLENGC